MNYLLEYINNPEDARTNFDLGREYESIGQTGAAISFYLRTAERTQDDNMQYEALLRMALCFEKQRTRDDTQKVLLQKAMMLIMDRPEAYYLLARAHERQQQWHEGWTVSGMALKVCRWDYPPLSTNVEYPGQWGILFEYGVCAWWVGETEQSRQIMFDLRYSWPLDQIHQDACDRNLKVCGLPKSTLPHDSIQYLFSNTTTKPASEPSPQTPVVRNTRPSGTMFSPEATPGFWVVDNFYANPNWVREFALNQEYEINHDGERGYIGTRTRRQFLFDGIKEQFEYIMNRRITRWEDHGMNGRFQYNMAGEPLVYHADLQTWAGMLYLTPDAPWSSGTRTHALKGTDIRHRLHPRINECFLPGSRNFDGTRFDTVDQIGNVYNRLVIFNAGYLHSAVDYFGFTKDNCRLWHMFFFD